MSHSQITPSQQTVVAALLRQNFLQKEIASALGVTPSTVSQEIARNKDADGVYRAWSAHKKKKARRIAANQHFRKIEKNGRLRRFVIKKLKQHWSPEQVAGRLRVQNAAYTVGKDTIYTYVYEKRPDLVKHLRCKKGSYRRRYGTRIREKQREETKIKRIDTRPAVVERRERLGDWEGDTIVGKDRTKRLVTNVDRRSGYGMIDKLDRVSVGTMHTALMKRFQKIPAHKKYTYTYDNGTELGKEDGWLETKIGMDVYRAYPYHSWERGCNENFNGLVREFFPKGTDFATVSDREVRRVERLLNNRPRKRLNYKTPREVFREKKLWLR